MQAYIEWMPIRAQFDQDVPTIYRSFDFGDLAHIVMLDTRLEGRDQQLTNICDPAAIFDSNRRMLSTEQEAWLLDDLHDYASSSTGWCLLGQQVMFGQLSDVTTECVADPDQWDGYAVSRARLLDTLRQGKIDNVVMLTGDAHSSWAMDITETPYDRATYDAATGAGSLAVEFVVPPISSAGPGGDAASLLARNPHAKFVEVTRQGYLLLDITPERARADWYFVDSVRESAVGEVIGASMATQTRSNRIGL